MYNRKKGASTYGTVKFQSIDDYHATLTPKIQKILEGLRQIIKTAAPKAVETISYNIPTFKQNKNLVHYAAYKEHIGFYPTAKPIVVFADKLKKYKTSKGAIQFPIDEPLPKDLIKEIVKFRVQVDKKNSSAKSKTK